MGKAADCPVTRRWEVNVWVKEVYRLEVEADTEEEAEDFARETYSSSDFFDSSIEAAIATEIEPRIETLYLQPDPDKFTHFRVRDVKIDASVYGPVPVVAIKTVVHRDEKGQSWANIDGEWYAVDNQDTVRLRKSGETQPSTE